MTLISKGFMLSVVAALAATGACAQSVRGESRSGSFEEYRKGLLEGYQGFRSTILEHYADFLNGEWHEYESLNGEKRYKSPKPKTAPMADTPADVAPAPAPRQDNVPAVTPLPVPVRTPAPEAEPEPEPAPDPAPAPGVDYSPVEFSFFDIPVQMPRIDFNIHRQLSSTADYGRQWKLLADGRVAQKAVPALKQLAEGLGLNDYLTFLLTKAYIEALFPEADDSSRFSAVHYLLANMGYGVRVAATSDGIPLLLVPFDRMVYGRTYMMVDGEKYYVFAPDSFNIDELGSKRIMTCKLPDNLDHGKALGLLVGELNLPYEPYNFEISNGPLTLRGELNRNIIPVLYRYPQMGVDGFAESVVQPALRAGLTEQIRSQLAALPADEAVEALLSFTQHAFEYATDEDYHGFEKPYFLEETLFYPKNDCEDRAIFYTYFLWNALGREAQLISFPGHESAGVTVDEPIKGASYRYNGTRFYISDPTYIGASTGMVMPEYRGSAPTVDFTYKGR